MLSKSEIKNISRLKLKKHRLSTGVFAVEGVKPVREAIHSRLKVSRLFVVEAQYDAFSKYEFCEQITGLQMKQISSLKTPPGVFALVEIPQSRDYLPLNGILLAESLNDPGNLGTLLRTADWFGIKTVILSEDSVDAYNPKTVQASMGSVFRVAVHYKNLIEAVEELKSGGVKVYGATLTGKNVYKMTFPPNFALLMGSESHGISAEILENCDEQVAVPAFGDAESLNVAVSCAVLLGEIKRSLAFKVK